MTHYISNVAAKAAMDAVTLLVNAGTPPGLLKIYAGTVPTDADTALGAATLLATLTFSSDAFGDAADASPGATSTAASITSDSSADNTGTAAFYRITNAAGTVITQGTVGTSGANINFNTVSFVSGATISVTSFTMTMPES